MFSAAVVLTLQKFSLWKSNFVDVLCEKSKAKFLRSFVSAGAPQ